MWNLQTINMLKSFFNVPEASGYLVDYHKEVCLTWLW
jgi:hypothetical protein